MSWYLCGDPAVHLLVKFLCCSIIYICGLSSILWYPLTNSAWKQYLVRLCHQLFVEGSCLIYIMCVCLPKWCPAHIVLCFCFVCGRVVGWLTNVASCSILSIFDCSFCYCRLFKMKTFPFRLSLTFIYLLWKF